MKQNSIKAWLLASRPKTLTGAAIPVMTGCTLTYIYGFFNPIPAVLCFLFAFLMQIDANFINDLYDFLKGTDRADRLGPERACAQGWISPEAMKKGILVTTILASLTGVGLLWYGGWEMIPVGVLCILFAFLYTAGPYPLAYHGWGDVLVLIFFGFVPVGCTFYVMAHSWNLSVTFASLACGLLIDTLLMVNNFRDREQDARINCVLPAWSHSLLVLFLFPVDRKNICSNTPSALSASAYSDHNENGTHQPRKRAESDFGGNIQKHVSVCLAAHHRAAIVNRLCLHKKLSFHSLTGNES